MAEDIQLVNALDCSDNSCFYANFRTYCTALLNVKLVFFSRHWSECWPHHGRTFSIYPCPLSFWLTLPRGVLYTSWILMLSIQAVHGLPRLRAPGTVEALLASFFPLGGKNVFFPNFPGKNSFCWQELVFSTSWQKITVNVIFATVIQVRNIVRECDCC